MVRIVLALLVVLAATAAAAPQLTDVQRLQLEKLALADQLSKAHKALADAQQALGVCLGEKGGVEARINQLALQREMAAWRQAFEASAPGFTWDFATSTAVPTNASPAKPDGR